MTSARSAGPQFVGRIAADLERRTVPDKVRAAAGPDRTSATTTGNAAVSRTAATAYSSVLAARHALTPSGILALQRTVGNAVVNRLLVQASLGSRRKSGIHADEEGADLPKSPEDPGSPPLVISRVRTRSMAKKAALATPTSTSSPKSKITRVRKSKSPRPKAKRGKHWHGKSPDPTKAYIVNHMLVRNDRDTSAFLVNFDAVDSTTGYGSAMSAIIGDWNHLPTGSPPSVKPPGYPAKDPFFTNYMVQGHLLNENLGGPGNNLANLAPISKAANSEHLHQIESFVKRDVIHKGRERHYNVTVLHGPPNPADFPSLATGPSGAMHPYFGTLPLGFDCDVFASNILDGSPGKLLHHHKVINKE